MAEAILNDVRYIFSINSEGFPPIHRTHSVTVIFPADAENIPQGIDVTDVHHFGEVGGIRYSRTTVHGRIEKCDAGIEDKYMEVATEAELIADDICRWCNEDCPRTSQNVPSFAGVWWSVNPEPTEKEIKEKRRLLHAYYKALVAEADKFWETNAGKVNVNDTMRRAARELKLERTWLYEAQPQNACPACGGAIPVGVAVCKHCNAVVNEAKARQFFPERFPAPAPSSEEGLKPSVLDQK